MWGLKFFKRKVKSVSTHTLTKDRVNKGVLNRRHSRPRPIIRCLQFLGLLKGCSESVVEEDADEIEVPVWWKPSPGKGMMYRREYLPVEHPESVYNYIKKTYNVDPEVYGIVKGSDFYSEAMCKTQAMVTDEEELIRWRERSEMKTYNRRMEFWIEDAIGAHLLDKIGREKLNRRLREVCYEEVKEYELKLSKSDFNHS